MTDQDEYPVLPGAPRQFHEARLRLAAASPMSEGQERVVGTVVGAAVRVHTTLGPGFAEIVYRRALCLELAERHIDFEVERTVALVYLNRVVGAHRLDLLVAGFLVVELKVVDRLDLSHKAQVLAYLRASGLRLGLLLNFKVAPLAIKRVIL